MAFNVPIDSNRSGSIDTSIVNQIHVDGTNVKVLPAGTPPSVVYRIGDGTVNVEGWDNVLGEEYLDFYISTGSTGAIGLTGEDGASAYTQAVDGGYTGSQAEFYALITEVTNNAVLADASATAAALSEANALSSENAAGADLVLTNADVVLTHADVVITHSDVVLTHADVVLTNNDVNATTANASAANNSAISASGSASTATTKATESSNSAAAALVSENAAALDLGLTNADVILTHADVILAEADKVQTGLDRLATNADVVLAEADKVQTGLDRIAVANDLVLTNQDTIDTAADRVQTGLDRTSATGSASAASTSETNALASLTSFTDIYLGALATAPTIGTHPALSVGDMYYDTVVDELKVYDNGDIWKSAGSTINGTSARQSFVATAGQTSFTIAGGYDAGFADVWQNGYKLLNGTNVTVTSGTAVVLTVGATVGDVIDVVAYGAFVLADHYTKGEADAKIVELSPSPSKSDIEALGIAASSITGALPAIDGSNLSGVGKVLQVVSVTKTSSFSSTATTYSDITGLAVSITPSSTSSKILVIASIMGSQDVGINDMYLDLKRDSVSIYQGATGTFLGSTQVMSSHVNWSTTSSLNYLDSPSSTSSITYKMQGKSNTGIWFINRSTNDNFLHSPSTITLIEIGA